MRICRVGGRRGATKRARALICARPARPAAPALPELQARMRIYATRVYVRTATTRIIHAVYLAISLVQCMHIACSARLQKKYCELAVVDVASCCTILHSA